MLRFIKRPKAKVPKEDDPIAVRYYVNFNTVDQPHNFAWEKLHDWFPESVINTGSGFVEIPYNETRKVEVLMRRSKIHFKKLNPVYSSPVKELLDTRKAKLMLICVILSTILSFVTTTLFTINFIIAILAP